MILTINLFDLFKAQGLIDSNEFLQQVLTPSGDGRWFVETEDKSHIAEIKRLFGAKNIRFKLKEE